MTRILFTATIVYLIFAKLVSPSQGGELPPAQISVYVQLSLLNPNGVLRKIFKAGPLAVQAVCVSSSSSTCNKTILNKQLNGAFGGNTRIKKRVSRQNPDIKFLHIGAGGLAAKKRELVAAYDGGFSDSDDLECQLYYSIKNNIINNVVIVVSLDSPVLKQNFCLASQVLQGLGLSLPNGMSFSQLWKNPTGGLYEFNDEYVARMVKSYGILGYIHMCPELKPGMKAPDIRRLLAGRSSCLDGFEFIPGEAN